MNRERWSLCSALAALFAVASGGGAIGCGSESSPARADGGIDSSPVATDAASPVATDAVSPAADAATPSGMDAATDVATAAPAFRSIAPCATEAAYASGSTVTASVSALEYTPKCLKVKRGTVVTFTGDFGVHPTIGSTLPARTDPGNPIVSIHTGTSHVVTYAQPGFFGYYCAEHGQDDGTGMAGVVWVTD